MYNFGKLTGRRTVFKVPDQNGDLVDSEPVLAFFDENDVEWHDLYKSVPAFDFYVALDDLKRVVSMEPDPEHSQIGGYEIIGISTEEANGYTRGQGGTAYGKQWNGTQIVEPVLTREEFPSVTPRQLRLTLVRNGFSLTGVETAINALPDGTAKEEAQIDWEYATKFNRLDPTLLTIASALNLTDVQVDAMWDQALAIA